MHLRRCLAAHRMLIAAGFLVLAVLPSRAQTPPTEQEIAGYKELHASVIGGSAADIERQVHGGADINARDGFGRTPLMVAAYRRDLAVARALIRLGASVAALDHQSYDAITIAATQNDTGILQELIAAGGSTRAITGPFGGTALSAAARAGRAEAVELLIAARAPLDHVNNLGATALIEAIVSGDGGADYQATLAALIKGGADVNLPARDGALPLALARARGHAALAQLLEAAGAKS